MQLTKIRIYGEFMNITAQLLIISAAVFWGLLGVFTRPLMAAGLSPMEMVASRYILSAVFLFLFLLSADREKLKIELKDIRIFLCMGIFGLALNCTCYFIALELIPLSAASILLYTSPYMVMLLSALVFKEKITIQKISSLLIAFTGCVMTVGIIDSIDLSVIGIAAGLGAAFFYSLYTIIGKVALQKYSPFTVMFYSFITASMVLTPFCDFGKIITLMDAGNANLIDLLIVVFFLTLLPFVCYTKGLKKLEPSRVSILSFAEPLTAAVAGVIVFNETLSAIKIFGIALVFLSLIVLNLKRR
jgi:drug/metabolite transporter (DMT)-like permease